MKNIILKPVLPQHENPFRQFPQLKSIWRPELAILAEEAIDETFEDLANNPGEDIGGIFLIYQEDTNDLMGITGYFPNLEDEKQIYLRWHGLFKEYQGSGYSQNIIQFIIEHVKKQYPNAEDFIEYMPVIDAYIPIKEYFEKIGFEKVGQPDSVDWSDYQWQSYTLKLQVPTKKIDKTLLV
jgi:GNAT superfamily N-acetyltransferase